MSVTVVGSIAFDAVKTPFGVREKMLGGSAVHFALSASFFDTVHVVGPVGDDFGEDEYAVLRARGVDTDDIEHIAGGKTFFWAGEYGWDLNARDTLDTQLGVFERFEPKLSDVARDADVVFLANIQPDAAAGGARPMRQRPGWTALDSMNLWIDIARDSLIETISGVDCILFNDAELKQLTEAAQPRARRRQVREWGPSVIVAKQGEYGAAMITDEGFFGLPAFPLETVIDPTGAGDCFAGRFHGLHRRASRRRAGPRPPASSDGLRHRAGLVQRRGVRCRADDDADERRDRGTCLGPPADHALHREAGRVTETGQSAASTGARASRSDTIARS